VAIVKRLRRGARAALLAGAFACGAGDDTPVPAANPAPAGPAPTATGQADPGMSDTMQAVDNTGLLRETFSYRGAGRDPFESLIMSGSVRPMPRDLRVAGITYDPRYPQRSVATLRDTTDGKRYSLRVGDQVGRLRVAEIRPEAVVVILEELGVQRQIVLALRRRQEAIQ
jgi:hypothetical protein